MIFDELDEFKNKSNDRIKNWWKEILYQYWNTIKNTFKFEEIKNIK